MVIDEQGKEGENGVPSLMLKARGVPAGAIFGRLRKYVMHAVGSFSSLFSWELRVLPPHLGTQIFWAGGYFMHSSAFPGVSIWHCPILCFSSLRFFFSVFPFFSVFCYCRGVCVQSSSLYINLYCVVFFRFSACLLTALKSLLGLFLVCVGPPSKLGIYGDVLGRLAE